MKKFFLPALAVICSIATLFISAGCSGVTESKIFLIEDYYGVSLPRGAELVYECEDFGWLGDGTGYYVFACDSEPEEFISDMTSVKGGGEELKGELMEYFNGAVEKLSVESRYRPDLSVGFYWNYGESLGGLPAIYTPAEKKLYICMTRI